MNCYDSQSNEYFAFSFFTLKTLKILSLLTKIKFLLYSYSSMNNELFFKFLTLIRQKYWEVVTVTPAETIYFRLVNATFDRTMSIWIDDMDSYRYRATFHRQNS